MTPAQKFLLMISNRLDAQEKLIDVQTRFIQDMTAMSKTHYAVPKAVSAEEACRWWVANTERFEYRDQRGRFCGYNVGRALEEFCNERAEMKPKGVSPERPPQPTGLTSEDAGIECELCFEEKGSYACVRPAHRRNLKNNDIEGAAI